MPLAAIPAIAWGGLASAGGSIAGGLLGSSAAKNAAQTQAQAANNAAQLQYKASQDALNFEKQQYQQSQANLAPWLQSGAGALANLNYLLGLQNPTTQGAMSGSPGAFNPTADNSLKPRYLNDTYSGSLFGSDSASQWQYAGQHGNQDIYQRTNGSPAWYAVDQNGWVKGVGGKGSPNFQLQTEAQAAAPGSPASPTSAAAVSNGMHGVTANNVTARPVGPQPVGGGPIAASGGPIAASGGPIAASGGPIAFGGSPTAPTQANGTTDLGAMVNPGLGAFGSLMQPFGEKFAAPTDITMQNDPGYAARLKLGTDALQKSAAARGNLLTGGTAKALTQFGQDYGSNEYGNVYNRAWNEYANRYNQYQQNQTNQYNRLASLAGVGQQTAGQLGTLGQSASNNVTGNLLNTAQNMGQQYNNSAAATASGYVGGANAWQNALSGAGNNLMNLYMLKQMGVGGPSFNSNGYAVDANGRTFGF